MVEPRIPDRLRSAALTPLWRTLHDRFSSGRPVSRIKLTGLTAENRAALADLLGLDRYPGESTQISVSRLDAVLSETTGYDSRVVTEAIAGRPDDRAAERARDRRERADLWAWLAAHPVVTAEPALRGWADDVRRGGVLGRSVPETRTLLNQALTVLAALPADGRPLPTFAMDTVRDPHGLNDDTRLAGLVLRALATRYGEPPPDGAEARRALWRRAGVACDALSTVVLAAGLRPGGGDVLARSLRMWADAGRANAITLAQLQETAGLCVPRPVVWVVENPSILALAERRFGPRCPPLVCTSGWPNSAGVLLLRKLRAAGAELRYHGDLDGEGLRIAAYVLARCAAIPWRMSARDYLEAVMGSARDVRLAPGRITDVPWDPELGDAIRRHGVAVHEELVAETLLADLAPTGFVR